MSLDTLAQPSLSLRGFRVEMVDEAICVPRLSVSVVSRSLPTGASRLGKQIEALMLDNIQGIGEIKERALSEGRET